jgi:hypothetical protein
MRSAVISGEGMFTAAFMGSWAYIASPIPRLVCMEVVEALSPALGQGSNITMMRIKAIVHVAVKPMRAMKPGTGSNKHSADKPIGAVVAVGSAVIRGIVEISVRAHWGHPDVDPDADLGLRRRCRA